MINKRYKHFLAIWIVVVISFNAVYCILENNIGNPKFDSLFWIACVFTNAMFVGYFLIGKYVFSNSELKDFYYKLSELRIVYIGVFVNIAISITFALLENLQQWIGTIICIVVFAIVCIYVVKADEAVSTVQEIDNSIKEKVSKKKDFTNIAETLYKQADNKKIREILRELYNEFKFSNYHTKDEDNDSKIETYLEELKLNIDDEKKVDVVSKKIIKLLKAR